MKSLPFVLSVFLRFGNIFGLQCDISLRCTPPLLKYPLQETEVCYIITKYYSNDGMHDIYDSFISKSKHKT